MAESDAAGSYPLVEAGARAIVDNGGLAVAASLPLVDTKVIREGQVDRIDGAVHTVCLQAQCGQWW